jgi:hypothetical protein
LGAGPELVGCSDSQRDEDADGVMSDIDVCPDTPAKEDVQTEGEYAGCSLDERVSKGDTSAVLQKNLLWIVIGSLFFIGLAVMGTLMVLRRKEQAPTVSGSFEQSMVAPTGFAQAPAVAAAPQVAADYTQLPGGGGYSTGAMGDTIYNAPDGSNWQMQTDSSFIRIN